MSRSSPERGDVGAAPELHVHQQFRRVVHLVAQIDDGRVEGDQRDAQRRQPLENAGHDRAVDHRVHHGGAAIDRHDDVPGHVP